MATLSEIRQELANAGTKSRLLGRITGGRTPLPDAASALSREGFEARSLDYEQLRQIFLAAGLVLLVLSVAVRIPVLRFRKNQGVQSYIS